jgi:hypothetical protein
MQSLQASRECVHSHDAKQSIFSSIYLKEDGLPRPLRGLAMTISAPA